MRRLVVLLSFLLGLYGCSGIGQLIGSPGQASRDICVLTTAEIEELWGWPDTRAESEQSTNGPTCGYTETSGPEETAMRFNLGPVDAMRCDEARNFEGSQEIPGIGDWAYWSGDRQKMYVKLGNDCLVVVPNGPGTDIDFMTGLTEITRLAASRLQ